MNLRLTDSVAISLALTVFLFSCASTADLQRGSAAVAGIDPARPFAESAFVDSAGIQVHYRHWLPDREPRGQVLLLHGFGSSTFTWRFLVPELVAAGWEVAAVDIPPFGYSDKSEAVGRLGYDRGSQLWAVPDALGWKDPIAIIGHSMGALFGTAMAGRQPERISALVFLAGAVRADGKGEGGAPPFAGLLSGYLEARLHSWSGVRSLLAGFNGGKDVPDTMVAGYFAPFQLPGGVQALFAWSDRSAEQPPVHPAAIKVPTLLIWGDRDTAVPLKVGKGLASAMATSTLVILPGQGHLAHELYPELVDPLVLDFLEKLPGER